jgi:hypothetical protein
MLKQYLPDSGLWNMKFTRSFGDCLPWARQESLPNSLHVLLWNTGIARTLPFAHTPYGFEFTIPDINGLPGWRILPKTYAKIVLNSWKWLTLRVIRHIESLPLLCGRHIYCYRHLATNWWFENELPEMFFHCYVGHLSALNLFIYMDFLKVFISFVKTFSFRLHWHLYRNMWLSIPIIRIYV